MKVNRLEGKGLKKTVLTAVVAIGASAILFQGVTLGMTEAEFKKTNTIPTSYANVTASLPQAAPNSLPEGYTKANYTVGAHNNEWYHTQIPTSKDMTKEDASEIGAQALWEIFDLNLEGQVIEMGYQQPSEGYSRSIWTAEVMINDERSYFFTVDSVTGELISIGRFQTLDRKAIPAVDAALEKNPQEYVALAKKLAEKYNVVHSTVKSVAYDGQGYATNGQGSYAPQIDVEITGENGEVALMIFSRDDGALVQINFNREFNEKFIK
ncbi:hypothetical protein MHZ92_15490 [Sporosarcina sp. ACRSL]|uniref:hypothetical protein n=1 Tax=Sporosarcina sp. ACRSL TaxID=2918215 RepID=UPI001EF3E9C0|nr:hypothetical protein [Sporosarcina sp. ACRSL]MCG7345537.1 hypothetical protein [Sporosarcina sp. ACRSL]